MTDSWIGRTDVIHSTTESTIHNNFYIWQLRAIVPVASPWNDRPNYMVTNSGHILRPGPVGSPKSDLQCWPRYSTHDKADAAVEIIARYMLGFAARSDAYDGQGYLDVAEAAGYAASDVIGLDDAIANKDTIFTTYYVSRVRQDYYWTSTDKVFLPQSKLIDAHSPRGLVLDSEAQDGRTPARQLALLQRLAALCAYKGLEFLTYPNPLNGAGAGYTGYTASNLAQIHQTANLKMCITAWPPNLEHDMRATLTHQLALLKGPAGDQVIDYSKLVMTVAIGTGSTAMSVADAQVVREFILRGFGGITVWRNLGQAGGVRSRQYNQVLATVLGLALS